MSAPREIEQLQRKLEEAEQEREQAKKQIQQLGEQVEELQEELQEQVQKTQKTALELQEQVQKTQKTTLELQEQVQKNQKTTLGEYLRDCHLHLFKALRIADTNVSSTGHATRVNEKYYPMWLRPWDEFTGTERHHHFAKIEKVFGDKRLFPESIATRDKGYDACPAPVSNENGIVVFGKIAMESPVQRIFEDLLVEPDIRQEFNFIGLQFCSNGRQLKQQGDIGQAEEDPSEEAQDRQQQPRPSKRFASEQKVKPRLTYPDGLGIRTHVQEDENLAFVYDYKAAHKLAVEDLKLALIKEKLFMEVIDRANSNKNKTDPKLKERDMADERVAMALTQVFDYMVTRGVAYGYVAAGESLVFLHVEQDDLRTLYYHQCIPDEAVDENGSVKVSHTAVAQLASFCLLALRSEALSVTSLNETIKTAELENWPEPYPEAEEHLETGNMDSSQSAPESQSTDGSEFKSDAGPSVCEFSLRSRSTCRDATTIRRDDEDEDDEPSRAPTRVPGRTSANKRKEGPSSSSAEDHKMSSDSVSTPTRQYCTQACLLGLKRGWDLDEKCPNLSSHRTIESGTRHPINASEFASLVGERLRQNPFQDCVALDPYGFRGKIGAIGALFKLELAQYGYTFVSKGTQSVHLHCLQHESLVYSRLERLQGEVVPVYLGIVNLGSGFLLPGGARVVHMMLMSWGGEVAADAGVPDLAVELRRSSQAVWSEGVDHGDERGPNILWSEERRRVMLIDFDRATLRPALKHKQVSKLSCNSRKRNGKKMSLRRMAKTIQ